MDISISCGGNSTEGSETPNTVGTHQGTISTHQGTVSSHQGVGDSTKGGSQGSGLVYVSLSISALLALVVFVLVAILIVVCIFSRIKRSTGR